MRKFSNFVIKFKWVFIGLFIAATVFCTVMIFNTKVVYDLSTYVPTGSNTEKAVTLMKKEFDDKGSANVMVKGVTKERAVEIGTELSAVEGVAIATFDEKNDYKNNAVLYTLSLEDYDATDGSNATIKRILEYTSDKDAYVCGQSATSYYTRKETVESVLKIGVAIIIAIFAMLLFTSKSYFELVLMLIVFGVSVVLNMGTNFVFNGISYISDLVALVLQLALSIDYSVVLLHRYMEERMTKDVKEAAVIALSKGIVEILSSSLTTIAGLCALLFMTLPIGVEMGLSLAKGILFSLLTVCFLMPSLLVLFDKLLEKSKHKSFVPNIVKPARAIVKARKVIVPVFVVILALSCAGQFYNSYGFNLNSSTNTVRTQKAVAEEFGNMNTLVVIVPKDGGYEKERELIEYVTEKPLINKVTSLSTTEMVEGVRLVDEVTLGDMVTLGSSVGLSETLAKIMFTMYKAENDPDLEVEIENYKVEVLSLLEFAATKAESMGVGEYAAELSQVTSARANFQSENYSRIMFNINAEMESAESFALIEELYGELGSFYDEFYLAGETPACYDMAKAFPRDNIMVSLFTTVFVLVVLLFTFKNLLLPMVLMLLIQGGIWMNFVIPFLAGRPIFFIGYLLISAVQMGATIDYAIILTNRYKAYKNEFSDRFTAMAEAQNAVFPTIITSGVILTVTGFTLSVAAAGIVAELGTLLGIGAAFSVLLVLFVLPSLLLVCEKVVDKADYNKLFSKFKRKKK